MVVVKVNDGLAVLSLGTQAIRAFSEHVAGHQASPVLAFADLLV
jgi:hypothetical protein